MWAFSETKLCPLNGGASRIEVSQSRGSSGNESIQYFISEINYANFIFVGHLGKKGRTRSRYVRDECGQIVNIIVKRQ